MLRLSNVWELAAPKFREIFVHSSAARVAELMLPLTAMIVLELASAANIAKKLFHPIFNFANLIPVIFGVVVSKIFKGVSDFFYFFSISFKLVFSLLF